MENRDDRKKGQKARKNTKKTEGKSKPAPRKVVIAKPVQKDLDKLPEWARDVFITDLMLVAEGEKPFSDVEPLFSAGDGVMELKQNGRPAYRCMYHLNTPGQVTVLHATAKTSNGQDKQLVATTKARVKSLK
ncbi:type II toxin-antitoxin system RelE/ParE family toxin [Stenotrophomonas geniculata]|uniref:type II toxin-antitoxin system RelE/ParE family toxin n=1 Tax=Stenotrophomonas geniculata TaxID=86188 RepID=UPI002E7704A2|nr:type II toxin-antitoxin system RelE/ParE family toxin [Stenotrophomonas geniculata]